MGQLSRARKVAVSLGGRLLLPRHLERLLRALALLVRAALRPPRVVERRRLRLLRVQRRLQRRRPRRHRAAASTAATATFASAAATTTSRLVAQRGELDLHREHLPLEVGDVVGLRLLRHAQPRRRLVEQVDRLVGQLALGHVAMRVRDGGDDGAVGDRDPVVRLVALLEAAQDRDRLLDARFGHHHRLEAPRQRHVLLDQTVLVRRRRADARELASRQLRLEKVGRVDGALGGAGADDGVELVDEEDDLAVRLAHVAQHRLQPLLELAAVLGARHERAEVERHHAPAAHRVGHLVVGDALREALDHRRLAHARLADEHRVVLPPARQHLDRPPDLLLAPEHRVELARARLRGQVGAVLFERLALGRGERVDPRAAAAAAAAAAGRRLVAGGGAQRPAARASGERGRERRSCGERQRRGAAGQGERRSEGGSGDGPGCSN